MLDKLPLNKVFRCQYRIPDVLSPRIRRIVAENPGPFTFYGTGTYIIGHGSVAVIDPGPALASHLSALLDALAGETVSHILVTHTHRDHSPASRPLAAATGATVYGFGPHGSGRRPAAGDGTGATVEAGADLDFEPDVCIADGDIIEGEGWSIECVHTPGHTANHVCYQLREEQVLFSGDHVMGWSTSVIAPPDGHMGDYLASLRRLLARRDRCYWPTHGPRIDAPAQLVEAFIEHRLARQRHLLDSLRECGGGTIDALLPTLYPGLADALRPAAARSIYAAMLYLVEQGTLRCDGEPTLSARYELDDA